MKSSLKRLLGIALAIALIAGLVSLVATADTNAPTVTYDASENVFTFANADVYDGETNPDLFKNLKDLYPGDEVTEEITIAVKNVGHGDTVNLYLEADFDEELNPNAHDHNEDYELLNTAKENPAEGQILLSVKNGNNNYSGTLDDRTGDNRILLGSFSGNGETTLTVTVSIPITAGNEIMGKVSKVGWKFTAEVNEKVFPNNPPELNKDEHFGYIVGYPDGTIKPEKNITRAEVATIFFRLLTDESRTLYWSTSNPYSDVSEGQWFNNAISTLSNAGILNGYSDGTFNPERNITRAEFATIAIRFFSNATVGSAVFPDISGHWAEQNILKAANAKIINGYPDGTFRPDRYITRAEAITIINRVLGRCPNKDHLHEDMVVWSDNANTSAWYYEQIQEASNSHEYTLETQEENTYEIWQSIQPMRDWVAFEKAWATVNS